MKFAAILKEAIRGLFSSPVTIEYPFTPAVVPDDFRGLPLLIIENCTGCTLCAKDCPTDTIKMVPHERTKRKLAPLFEYWKCIRCAQCVYSCKYDALYVSDAFEVATYSKDSLTNIAILNQKKS